MKKRNPSRKINILYDAFLSVEKTVIHPNIAQSKSKRLFKMKNIMITFLRPIHLLKIFKNRKKVSGGIQLHVNNSKLPLIIDRRRNKHGKLT
jgi:hypothetical protein